MIPPEPDDQMLTGFLDPLFGVAIAYVISGWAIFENELDEAIWDLAGVEGEYGACVTAQISTVAGRFNALTSLARLKNKPEQVLKKTHKLSERALALADKRNRIAHDPFFTAYESGKQYRLQKTSKGKLDFNYKSVTISELKATADDIASLTADFRELFRKSLASWADYQENSVTQKLTHK